MKRVLDEVAGFVGVFVDALNLAVALGAITNDFPRASNGSITRWSAGLVCQQCLGSHIRQQRVGPFQIMGLARRQDEVQRIAQRIDKRMNLGA